MSLGTVDKYRGLRLAKHTLPLIDEYLSFISLLYFQNDDKIIDYALVLS